MPESAQKVLSELTNAGLLSSDEVTKYDDFVKVGVEALLERLVEEKRITEYQARKFLAGESSDIYFGDYVVMEELGKGGMGTVLLAKHRRMEREVAIKVLPVTALESEASVARFYQEVKVAAQLTHPNIVHAYDAGEHHGFHYLVMEYVRGHDLAHVLDQLGPIPAHLALDYIQQAAKGLEYAHRKGVVHRDIKPSNLLLDDEGVVKILDMGLARLGQSGIGGHEVSRHLTTTGQVMGTVEYMSPEQAEDTRVADARSDIYSLGCTLYRLVTGIAPFARDTVVKTILAHRESPIPNLSATQVPGLAPIDGLFRKMVAKNPDDRIQTSTQLIQEITRLTDHVDFEKSCEIVDIDIEVIQKGESPSDFPTVYKSNPSSAKSPDIEYQSEVVPNTPSGGPKHATSNSVGQSPPVVGYPSANLTSDQTNHTSQPQYIIGKSHRGGLILTMGIFALLLSAPYVIGIPLQILTWILAKRDLKEMNDGMRDPDGRTLTKTGRILSMVGFAISFIVALASTID